MAWLNFLHAKYFSFLSRDFAVNCVSTAILLFRLQLVGSSFPHVTLSLEISLYFSERLEVRSETLAIMDVSVPAVNGSRMCSCCRSRREDAGRDCTAACSWFHLRWRRLLLWICNPVVWSLFLDVNWFLCSVCFWFFWDISTIWIFCITCEYLMTPGCDVLAWSVTRKRRWVWSREVSHVTHLPVFCSIACLWYFLIQTSRVFLYGVRSARTVTRVKGGRL